MNHFDIEFASFTDIGKIREKNEDNAFIDSELGLGVVADGMGGHSAGEIASSIAVSVLTETIRKINNHTLQIPTPFLPKLSPIERKLLMAANLANAAIYSTAQSSEIYKLMGTTLTAALLDHDAVTAVHVGDSRIYLYRRDVITQITTDHSLAMEHVRRGLLTKEEADRSKMQNILTRAMGIKKNIEFDLLKFPVQVGDILILCSDGLYKGLTEHDIQQILHKNSQLPSVRLCKLLVRLANERDGQDNISAVVIKILAPRKLSFRQKMRHFFSSSH